MQSSSRVVGDILHIDLHQEESIGQGEGSARASVGQEKKLLDRRFLTKPRHALNVNDISK